MWDRKCQIAKKCRRRDRLRIMYGDRIPFDLISIWRVKVFGLLFLSLFSFISSKMLPASVRSCLSLALLFGSGVVHAAPAPEPGYYEHLDAVSSCESVLFAHNAAGFCSSWAHLDDATRTMNWPSNSPVTVTTTVAAPPCSTTVAGSTVTAITTVSVSGSLVITTYSESNIEIIGTQVTTSKDPSLNP